MKLGIVGAGMIVMDFLTITQLLDEIEVTAICGTTRDEEALSSIKSKYNISIIVYDYDELLGLDVDTIYVAVPNMLHYEFAKRALEANKNVIVEKPFTTNYIEAVELSKLALKNNLFLFEAINNQYLPNYKKIKELLPVLGEIKVVQCNYSQYSSRYNSFKDGNILPAFDPKCAGGALMDLNIYNIHYVVGLFGKPHNVEYFPNIERGIDTSGILILDYDKFKCICIGAKDCKAPIAYNIQGDKGCIHQDTPANVCGKFELLMNDGKKETIDDNKYEHRMVNEFLQFIDVVRNNDFEKCSEMLKHTLIVSEIQSIARKKAGIVFPADD